MSGFVPMAEYQRVCEERDRWREQCAFLEGEGRSGKAEAVGAICQQRLGLTPGESALVAALYFAPRGFLTYAGLNERIPAFRDPERSDHCVKVWGSRLRKKLGPGLIETVYDRGYRLTQKGNRLLDEALGGSLAA